MLFAKTKVVAWVWALLFVAPGLAAPEPAKAPKTQLETYLAKAALNNAGLRAAFHRWQASVWRRRGLATFRLVRREGFEFSGGHPGQASVFVA